MKYKSIVYKVKCALNYLQMSLRRETLGKISVHWLSQTVKRSPILEMNKLPHDTDPKTLVLLRKIPSKAILEIGTGNGDGLVQLAKNHSNSLILGIEQNNEYFNKTLRRISHSTYPNVKIIHSEAIATLRSYFPDRYFDEIYITCPDPWPKRRHERHRITYINNFRIILNKLSSNGTIQIITDNPAFAHTTEKSLAILQKEMPLTYFAEKYTTLPRHIFRTKYIKKWEKVGSSFWLYRISIDTIMS